MNKKRRAKNRDTAKNLAEVLAFKKRQAHICPECGMQGEYHWVQAPLTLADIINEARGGPPSGFWVCPKFYGEDGRRMI